MSHFTCWWDNSDEFPFKFKAGKKTWRSLGKWAALAISTACRYKQRPRFSKLPFGVNGACSKLQTLRRGENVTVENVSELVRHARLVLVEEMPFALTEQREPPHVAEAPQ